jgi:hypothetical protein
VLEGGGGRAVHRDVHPVGACGHEGLGLVRGEQGTVGVEPDPQAAVLGGGHHRHQVGVEQRFTEALEGDLLEIRQLVEQRHEPLM